MVNGLSIADLQNAVSATMPTILNDVIYFAVGLVEALLIFLFGWVVAVLVSRFFGGILKTIKFEQFLKEQKVHEALGTVVISNVLTKILYYYIVVIFLQQAFLFISLGTVATFFTSLLAYLPVLIGAVLLIVAAAIIGEFVKMRIIAIGAKSTTMHFLGRATKALIIFMGIMSGLETAGFKTTLIQQTFVVLAAAIAFGFALAFGIAFGLGSQEDARDWMKTMRKQFKV